MELRIPFPLLGHFAGKEVCTAMKQVSGGVCAAKGFVAAGVHCGVKSQQQPG